MPLVNGEIKSIMGAPLPDVDRLIFSELRRLQEAVATLPGGSSPEIRLRFEDFKLELIKVIG